MTKLYVALLATLPLASCTSNELTNVEDNSDAQKNDIAKSVTIHRVTKVEAADTTFKLDFFKSVPDTIDGCGEYFTYDTSKSENQGYIFLSNLSEFALIKVNGKVIYLTRDIAESKEINVKSYIAVYNGQGYKAVLTVNQVKAYDEGGFYSGTLQVTGEMINATFKVHGQAGC
jgi:hypothetical protein